MAIELKGLQRERIRRGIDRAELARLSGVTYTYVCELEQGKRRGGHDVVRRLSAALMSLPVIEGADELLGVGS